MPTSRSPIRTREPYRDSARLVYMSEVEKNGGTLPPSFPNFVDWRTEAEGFDRIASAMFPFNQTMASSTW